MRSRARKSRSSGPGELEGCGTNGGRSTGLGATLRAGAGDGGVAGCAGCGDGAGSKRRLGGEAGPGSVGTGLAGSCWTGIGVGVGRCTGVVPPCRGLPP